MELKTSADPARDSDTAANESAIGDLINQANEEAAEGRTFMEPKVPKGKAGRKRKNPNDPKWGASGSTAEATPPPEPEAPPVDYSAACRGLFAVMSSSLVRATKCPDAALTGDEIGALGDSWGKVIARYAPAFLNSHAELIGALAVTGAVGFRIKSVLEAEIIRRKAEAAATVVNAEVQATAH